MMQLFIVLFFVLVGGTVDHKSWRDKSIDNEAKAIADKHEAIDKADDEDDPPRTRMRRSRTILIRRLRRRPDRSPTR